MAGDDKRISLARLHEGLTRQTTVNAGMGYIGLLIRVPRVRIPAGSHALNRVTKGLTVNNDESFGLEQPLFASRLASLK